MTDQTLKLPRIAPTIKGSTDFPTPEDVEIAINLLGSGRLRLRLFLKSFETILGITDFQLDFIELIGRKKAVSPSDLAIELDVNKSTISGHLENLFKNKFIQETTSPEDKRKKQLSLTDLGLRLFQILNILQSRVLSRLLSFVGPNVFNLVKDHMNNIVAAIDTKQQAVKDFIHEKPEGLIQVLRESSPEELADRMAQFFPFLLGDFDIKTFERAGDL